MQQRFSKINSIVELKKTQILGKSNDNDVQINKSKSTNILKFSECIDTIDQGDVKNKKIIYALQGSEQTRLTNQSNLHQKIYNFTALMSKVKIKGTKNTQIQLKEVGDKKQEQNKQEQQKIMMRYFTEPDEVNEYIKCRRCGQFGHYQRSCTQQVNVLCTNCLGNHYSNQCKQFTCNRCNLQGHINKNCEYYGKRCYKCDKYGHRQVYCGTLILFEDLKNGEFQTKDLDRMRCLYCHKKGHINCYQNNKKDVLYAMYNKKPKQISFRNKDQLRYNLWDNQKSNYY